MLSHEGVHFTCFLHMWLVYYSVHTHDVVCLMDMHVICVINTIVDIRCQIKPIVIVLYLDTIYPVVNGMSHRYSAIINPTHVM